MGNQHWIAYRGGRSGDLKKLWNVILYFCGHVATHFVNDCMFCTNLITDQCFCVWLVTVFKIAINYQSISYYIFQIISQSTILHVIQLMYWNQVCLNSTTDWWTSTAPPPFTISNIPSFPPHNHNNKLHLD